MSIGQWTLVVAWLWLTAGHALAAPDEDENVTVYEFAADAMGGNLSATPGGAQDIGYMRDRAADGEVPHPATFTPEGLFSEHDLVVPPQDCRQLLCVAGQATSTRLLAQPDVRWLAQLGFSSNVEAETFRRAPLNLVAVVDKSGSMTDVLPLVKDSLRVVVGQLGPADRLSVVTYGATAQTVLRPTAADRPGKRQIRAAIDAIEVGGSTAMEDGLRVAFRVAKRSRRGFAGTTRVMLFTDERPNVGATDARSFMGLASSASRAGVGMTTVGVGVQFGAELATAISSVRGGNLFFFDDADTMAGVFEDQFDTMVTELAHDLHLRLEPGRGMKIAGVYGIPGDALRWARGGALELDIATVFLSRRGGGVFIALAPTTARHLPRHPARRGSAALDVSLSYTPVEGRPQTTAVSLKTVHERDIGIGLRRGRVLVDEVTALREATRLHHEANDQLAAYRLVHDLATRFASVHDATLHDERVLVENLERTLARLSGNHGEAPSDAHPSVDAVTGLPH